VTEPVCSTWVTGPIRAIVAGACVGSSAGWPKKVWPFWTTSRLVPSAEISFSSPAWAEADSPSTATIAATPMAIPRAESPARSLRVRSPTADSRARSDSRRFFTPGLPVVVIAAASSG
jgi:hypothetical protein